jgi:flavorubredoxin
MPTPDTTIHEVESQIYRIHTPVPDLPGGFSFNQYLIVDEAPMLFHAGPRALAPAVVDAIGRIIPVGSLRYVGIGHVEADECGGLNTLLAAAPRAVPVCSQVGAMVQVNDLADRPARPLAHGETLTLGTKTLRWIDAPHVPHGWDNGYLYEESTRTLLCGDLFSQPGTGDAPVVEGDILGPSEAFRTQMDYFAHAPNTADTIRRLGELAPRTLACMHGSAFRGDGGKLLTDLADALPRP